MDNFARNLKFPEFIATDVTLFFNLVNEYFITAGINQQVQKFQLLVLHLPTEVASRVRGTILNRPQHHPFDLLKAELIRLYSGDEISRISDLFDKSCFEGSCSDLLLNLQKLTDGMDIPDNFLKSTFISKLPNNLKLHALNLPRNLGLAELAQRLDLAFSLLDNTSSSSSVDVKLRNLQEKMADIDSNLTFLKNSVLDSRKQSQNSFRRQSSNTNRFAPHFSSGKQPATNSRQFVPRASNSQESPPICFYHENYGMNAHRCQPPCRYSEN